MLSISYQDDNEDYLDRSFEYDRRSRLPQCPLVELDTFDPIIGLEFKDIDLIRTKIAKWLVDLSAPPKPILSVRPKGDSLKVRDSNELYLLSAVMDNNFLKSLSISSTTGKPITCYLKFWSTCNSHSTYSYPGVLDDGPSRVILWLIGG